MARNKAGLHKNISSIFDGAPVPKGGEKQPSHGTGPRRIGYVPSKPPSAPPQSAPKPPKAAHLPPQPAKETPRTTARSRSAALSAKQPLSGWLTKKMFAPKAGISTARQKLMAMLIPVLLVLLIAVLVYNSGMISPRRQLRRTTPQPAGAEPAVPSGVAIAWDRPAEYTTASRDPMARDLKTIATPLTVAMTELVVSGIVSTEDTPRAIIGTTIVEEGDEILGATVVKINRDGVEFEKDGKRWTQKVRDTEVRE
ncbi:MAG: hypothetical protein ACYST6_10465 [Planctomycetota bacterium]|jgi:hypothetical protein